MENEILSESSSTIGDDWVNDANGSTASPINNDILKEISSIDGSPIQKEVDSRARKWTRLLGVQNRPNPLNDLGPLYYSNNPFMLRNECRVLAKKIGHTKSVPELEFFLTLYCNKINVDFDAGCGWVQILEKLIKFDLPMETLFNVFFAFTTKYTPREIRPGSQVFDLFRLLLQYHDPDLTCHLDSIKCPPSSFASDWLATLFACATEEKTCYAIWDIYIERGDPFLVFFLGLVIIINAKEQLMQFTKDTREDALALIADLPKSLTLSDVPDFVDSALYYSNRTPQCLREDFHGMLFGANLLDDFTEKIIKQLICLSVSVHEITRNERSVIEECPINYFIIDCRSRDHFQAGSVYGSFNLDAQLFVDEPEHFVIAMSHLEDFKLQHYPDDHLCFLGYGDAERDQYLNMVISRFLRDGKVHVASFDGGYSELHYVLSESGQLEKISHDEKRCVECNHLLHSQIVYETSVAHYDMTRSWPFDWDWDGLLYDDFPLAELPHAILLEVIRLLPLKDRQRMSFVCAKLRNMIVNNESPSINRMEQRDLLTIELKNERISYTLISEESSMFAGDEYNSRWTCPNTFNLIQDLIYIPSLFFLNEIFVSIKSSRFDQELPSILNTLIRTSATCISIVYERCGTENEDVIIMLTDYFFLCPRVRSVEFMGFPLSLQWEEHLQNCMLLAELDGHETRSGLRLLDPDHRWFDKIEDYDGRSAYIFD